MQHQKIARRNLLDYYTLMTAKNNRKYRIKQLTNEHTRQITFQQTQQEPAGLQCRTINWYASAGEVHLTFVEIWPKTLWCFWSSTLELTPNCLFVIHH